MPRLSFLHRFWVVLHGKITSGFLPQTFNLPNPERTRVRNETSVRPGSPTHAVFVRWGGDRRSPRMCGSPMQIQGVSTQGLAPELSSQHNARLCAKNVKEKALAKIPCISIAEDTVSGSFDSSSVAHPSTLLRTRSGLCNLRVIPLHRYTRACVGPRENTQPAQSRVKVSANVAFGSAVHVNSTVPFVPAIQRSHSCALTKNSFH